jgi:enamine deaminase RidA (YjgF/YER057c/UK114 family)
MTIKRMEIGPIMSRVVEYGGVVHLCGLTADDQSQSIEDQTRQVLAKIDHYLMEAATSKSRLLTATVYLSDMSMKEAMNTVWKEWIDRDAPPTRACVGAVLARPETLIEIVVSAARG